MCEDALKDKDVLALAEAVAMFNLSQIREEIALGIKVNVNGKIDKMQAGLDAHNAKHEEDMVRIMPALEYVEKQIRFTEDAATSGKVILWISGFIVSLGAAWLMVIKVLHS